MPHFGRVLHLLRRLVLQLVSHRVNLESEQAAQQSEIRVKPVPVRLNRSGGGARERCDNILRDGLGQDFAFSETLLWSRFRFASEQLTTERNILLPITTA